MLIIGVTGNIGSGKTTVSKILEEQGAYILDADKIARDVLAKDGPGYLETVGLFGSEILQENGEINRGRLADIVFGNPEKLRALNQATHKHVGQRIDDEISKVFKNKSHDIVCLDVPLLFESELDVICDVTWVVDADTEIKLNRAVKRGNMSRKEAELRLKLQTPSYVLKKKCDVVIENNKGYDELRQQVLSVLSELILS